MINDTCPGNGRPVQANVSTLSSPQPPGAQVPGLDSVPESANFSIYKKGLLRYEEIDEKPTEL